MRQLFGVVTSVGPNLSTIVSGKLQYKFSTSSNPVDMGTQVTFNEDDAVSTEKYAKNVVSLQVTDFVIRDLLERVNRLETKVFESNRFTEETRDYGQSLFDYSRSREDESNTNAGSNGLKTSSD